MTQSAELVELKNMLRLAKDKNITADELDLLASKARELNAIREQELNRLKKILAELEAQLTEFQR